MSEEKKEEKAKPAPTQKELLSAAQKIDDKIKGDAAAIAKKVAAVLTSSNPAKKK